MKHNRFISLLLTVIFLFMYNTSYASAAEIKMINQNELPANDNLFELSFEKNLANYTANEQTFSFDDQYYTITTYEPIETNNVSSNNELSKTILYSIEDGQKTQNKSDSTYTIRGTLTIYYEYLYVGDTECVRLNAVSGGYRWIAGDGGTQISSQMVAYGMFGSGSSVIVNENNIQYPSPSERSFYYTTGFSGAVNANAGCDIGATYEITLFRTASGSEWSVQIQNQL